MKLLLIARPFVFHGGVETATAGLVRTLVSQGYEVHLLSPPGQRPLPGVRLHTLPLPRLPTAGRVLALALSARIAVARGSWDVVQSHERTLCQHIYRAGEGCHRAYLAAMGRRPDARLHHGLVVALERRVFQRTPEIVAIARVGKAEIERLYGVPPARVSVVYNGVDLERFHPENRERHRRAARAESAIPAGAWTVLFVGSGFERKGLATAIEAFAILDDPDRRMIIIGKGDTGPYRAMAQRLGVDGRVAWLGPRPDLERWYAAADALVLPSRYEPFGNVHLEALASGTPVVTSARAGGAEVIEEGLNGAVVDPHDARAVAAALERLRAVPVARVIDTARRSAEPFTYEAQVRGFATLYRRLGAATVDFP